MKKFLSLNNWWLYFVVTYFISWTIWYPGALLLPANFSTLIMIAGAFGPFVSVLISIILTGSN